MSVEPISPELALVDPELRVRARDALAGPAPFARVRPTLTAAPPAATRERRPYPFWARVTAALWLLVLGILVGGAAIPHAQDKPRVVPPDEEPTVCKDGNVPATPRSPGSPLGQP